MTPDWIWLLPVALGFGLIRILRSAWFKGRMGEFKVNIALAGLLNRKTFRLLRNVTLPIGSATTQIDHLVFSPYGIFVIETKNLGGWIFGDPDHEQWTEVVFRFKQSFQNPLLQNRTHVKAVLRHLRVEPENVHNVVAFVGTCTLKTPMPDEVVCGIFRLAKFIKSKRVPVFTTDEVQGFIDAIQRHRLTPGVRTERAHVRSVKTRLSRKKANSETGCPRCGSLMVERVNRNTGERFLGCRRHPRCRGTRPLR
jgi:restriction system protein